MKIFGRLAATILIAATPIAAAAGDCRAMKASVPEADLWTCSAAWLTANTGHSETQCFTNADEGFTWVAKQFARADQIRQATCRHQGKTVRYREWYQQKQGGRG